MKYSIWLVEINASLVGLEIKINPVTKVTNFFGFAIEKLQNCNEFTLYQIKDWIFFFQTGELKFTITFKKTTTFFEFKKHALMFETSSLGIA